MKLNKTILKYENGEEFVFASAEEAMVFDIFYQSRCDIWTEEQLFEAAAIVCKTGELVKSYNFKEACLVYLAFETSFLEKRFDSIDFLVLYNMSEKPHRLE